MPPLLQLTREVSGALVAGVVDRESPWKRRFVILGGFLASGLRLARGMTVRPRLGARPAKPLKLWDFERCPYSRTVREALTELDLDAEVFPCPKGGTRFRSALEGKGVPRLEDPNTGDVINGSRAIVRHLHERYGTSKGPGLWLAPVVTMSTGLAARFLTAQRGAHARPSKTPEKPLELWSFEASPYCRVVRSALCELELPYVLHNLGKDSPRRAAFVEMSGKRQFPYLFDPNTGVRMFESLHIERYLEETYGAR